MATTNGIDGPWQAQLDEAFRMRVQARSLLLAAQRLQREARRAERLARHPKWPAHASEEPALIAVCKAYRVTVDQILSHDKHGRVATARHVAAWLLREVCQYSYPHMGAVLGQRSHSNMMNSYKVAGNSPCLRPLLRRLAAEITSTEVVTTPQEAFLGDDAGVGASLSCHGL